jgi:hypothetical protein
VPERVPGDRLLRTIERGRSRARNPLLRKDTELALLLDAIS